MAKGWHRESWRHSLARKGVQTKPNYLATKRYFQQETEQVPPVPSPSVDVDKTTQKDLIRLARTQADIKKAELAESGGTKLGVSGESLVDRLKGSESLTKYVESKAREQSGVGRVQAALKEDDILTAAEKIKELEGNEKATAKAIFSADILRRANAGEEIPLAVRKQLTFSARNELAKIREKGTFRGTVKEASKEAVFAAAERAIDKLEQPPKTAEEARSERAKEEAAFKETFGGVSNPITSGKTNVFLGDGDSEAFSKYGDGVFNFFPKEVTDAPIKPLSDTIIPGDVKFTGPTFGLPETPPTKEERYSKQIDKMFNSRKDFEHVDLSSYEKGEKAFKKGDREALLKAMNELDFQVNQQESKWKLADQLRVAAETSDFREYILGEKGGLFASFNIFGGAGELAEKTEKINKVKENIKRGADKARARGDILRNKLRIMDSTVPPDDSQPRSKVKIFDESKDSDVKGFFNEVADDTGEFFFS